MNNIDVRFSLNYHVDIALSTNARSVRALYPETFEGFGLRQRFVEMRKAIKRILCYAMLLILASYKCLLQSEIVNVQLSQIKKKKYTRMNKS